MGMDVPKMIGATGDPRGDVWYHARSALIQAISRVTLAEFMDSFNKIVSNVLSVGDSFYSDRGVSVHSLEVTRYECADKGTSATLQEIIQETTNRINRLQQQHSQNDVMKEKMNGDIEIEKQKKHLLEAKSENDRAQAIVLGEADGLRVARSASTFFSVLSEALPDEASRLQLFKFFEEQKTANLQTEQLSSGKATIFLSPQDMNLKLNVPEVKP